VPVILYNVPSRTASNILPETCLELAKSCDNIIGIKESSGNFENMMKVIKDKPENFLVISGNDMDVLPVTAIGGAGVISVLANAYPAECSEIVQHALKYNFRIAKEIQFRLLELTELLFAEGNPGGIKAMMSNLNLCQNTLRLPLVPVSRSMQIRISRAMEALK
jgi:4-hydroxy-tetrahydrodipicolinate synthase